MAVNVQSEHGRIIRRLIPLSTLPASVFATLCEQLEVENAESGQALFRRGDNDSRLYYLLDGEISLQSEFLKIDSIKSDSEAARFAIAHQIPRKIDAVASGKIQYLSLDVSIIKSLTEAEQEEKARNMNIEEPEENDDDWMTNLLRSPIFRDLPPANLQRIIMGLQEIAVNAGEVIIRQGEIGDCFYIIKKGRALISRKPTENAKEIKLAQLGDLDTFGEDALISGEPRNVTVSALTNMTLLRLGKEQFLTLIKQPILKYVDFAQATEYVDQGANLIDVRGPDEYKKQHLPRSINVPIFSLRMYLKTLNRQHPIIVVCEDGRASENAAFILMRNKFSALILAGGIAAVPAEKFQKPASFNIDDGVETANYEQSEPTAMGADTAQASSDMAVDEVALRQLVHKLKQKCNNLETENLALEMKCKALIRQLHVAKLELEKLKGGG